MADIEAALGQQILDVAQRQGNRMYIITTRRMTSGELLKWLCCEPLGHSIVVGKSVERQS